MLGHWKKLMFVLGCAGLMVFITVTASEASPLRQEVLPDGLLRRSRTGARVNFLFIAPFAMLLQLYRVRPRTGVFGRSRYIPIRVNLSTSRTSHALAEIMIRELYEQSRTQNLPGVDPRLVERLGRRPPLRARCTRRA